MSFSGVKTALLYAVRDLGPEEAERRRADLAASYQHAIVEALVDRCRRGLRETGAEQLALGGGVAANGPLRARVRELGVPVSVPPMELCTDNAAMIASAARWVEPVAFPGYLDLEAYASGQRAAA
jgi:N6-L-threonylcarbamoyladenine synthase